MGRSGVTAATKTSIEIRFYYRGVRCKERIKLEPTPANLKYCERLKAEVTNAIARGTFDYAQYFPDSPRARKFGHFAGAAIKVEDQLMAWLRRMEREVQPSTYVGYKNAVMNRLIPEFGSLMMSDFNRPHLRRWLDGQTLSRKRIVNLLIPLRAIFAEAAEDSLIDADPFVGWRYKVREDSSEEDAIDPFTQAEIKSILEAAQGQDRNLFQFAFGTGLRTSELIGLKWKDVDEDSVRIRRAVVVNREKVTKTYSGRRTVKLTPMAKAAITAQKAHSRLAGDWVFLNPRTGERWINDGQIRDRAWTPALKKAKVRYRYPYQTRHTFASIMLSAGENPMWVANQIGHKDWSRTVKIYGRYIPEVDPLAGTKGAEFLS